MARPLRPRARRKGARAFGGYTDAEAAPEELQSLFDALGRAGVARGEAETLEAFARRLDEGAWRFAADTLREYAAYRYGGVGDGGAVQRALRECAARVVAAGAPRTQRAG